MHAGPFRFTSQSAATSHLLRRPQSRPWICTLDFWPPVNIFVYLCAQTKQTEVWQGHNLIRERPGKFGRKESIDVKNFACLLGKQNSILSSIPDTYVIESRTGCELCLLPEFFDVLLQGAARGGPRRPGSEVGGPAPQNVVLRLDETFPPAGDQGGRPGNLAFCWSRNRRVRLGFFRLWFRLGFTA